MPYQRRLAYPHSYNSGLQSLIEIPSALKFIKVLKKTVLVGGRITLSSLTFRLNPKRNLPPKIASDEWAQMG